MRVRRGVSLRRLGNHRRLCWTICHSAFLRQMVVGRHITDAGTIALAFVIREFVGNDIPQFTRASQNIAAAAMLLRGVPEPIDPQE